MTKLAQLKKKSISSKPGKELVSGRKGQVPVLPCTYKLHDVLIIDQSKGKWGGGAGGWQKGKATYRKWG